MSCQFVRESISEYLDDRLTGPERRSVVSHLASCQECSALQTRMSQVRQNLRSMPAAVAPAKLATDLRGRASKEVIRRRDMSSPSALLRFCAERTRLVMDNLMRPLAAPVAGGFTSALVIFGTLIPYLGLLRIPTDVKVAALHTEASLDSAADFGSKTSDDTLLEVQID